MASPLTHILRSTASTADTLMARGTELRRECGRLSGEEGTRPANDRGVRHGCPPATRHLFLPPRSTWNTHALMSPEETAQLSPGMVASPLSRTSGGWTGPDVAPREAATPELQTDDLHTDTRQLNNGRAGARGGRACSQKSRSETALLGHSGEDRPLAPLPSSSSASDPPEAAPRSTPAGPPLGPQRGSAQPLPSAATVQEAPMCPPCRPPPTRERIGGTAGWCQVQPKAF